MGILIFCGCTPLDEDKPSYKPGGGTIRHHRTYMKTGVSYGAVLSASYQVSAGSSTFRSCAANFMRSLGGEGGRRGEEGGNRRANDVTK